MRKFGKKIFQNQSTQWDKTKQVECEEKVGRGLTANTNSKSVALISSL